MSVDTPLPERAPGLVTYNREEAGRDQFGTAETVIALLVCGMAWEMAGESPFSVGDLSREGGGPFPPHSSHRNGLDADIRPLRRDGRNLPVTRLDVSYSRERTRRLIRTLRDSAAVETVLFNDPELVREGLAVPFAGHDNHIHVRFAARQPRAVKEFQVAHGVAGPGDAGFGVCGPRTRAALAATLTPAHIHAYGHVADVLRCSCGDRKEVER